MRKTANLLFVYGTLRRGTGHRMQALLTSAAEFVDEASFQGCMFRVARFPGVVESTNPRDQVTGDVFRIRQGDPIFGKLDRYEGCDRSDPAAPYTREVRQVTLMSGKPVNAWVYLYNRPTEQLERIVSGDFLTHHIG
jgi:gamma-glutamylcyclotransferase (GGCT)/AIG2-like uncharacterized protein YtfP